MHRDIASEMMQSDMWSSRDVGASWTLMGSRLTESMPDCDASSHQCGSSIGQFTPDLNTARDIASNVAFETEQAYAADTAPRTYTDLPTITSWTSVACET